MSRFGDWDGDEDFNNEGYFWEKRAQLALAGRRGRKALAELRDALRALPERRLIGGALCTVGLAERIAAMPESDTQNFERARLRDLLEAEGEGVCAIGAYVWAQKVKAGMDPQEAFAALPVLDQEAGTETARLGEQYGLTYTLAWELAYQNDDPDAGFGALTPAERYTEFLNWIDYQLRQPPLQKPPPRPQRVRAAPARHVPAYPPGTEPLELGL